MKNKPSPKMKFLRDGMISRINVQLRSSPRRRGRQRAVVQRRSGRWFRDGEEVSVVETERRCMWCVLFALVCTINVQEKIEV